ncbi:MAG TPA: glycosyltransferase [Vicinamibacterales bacterium]|nr:glycosyltransferase [Vicinamibacterales bacterium]
MATPSLYRRDPDDEIRLAAHPSGGRALRIAFLIDRLNHAGAAQQLVMLAKALRDAGHSVVVIVFYDDSPLEADLRRSGVPVRTLGKQGRWDTLGFVRRLVSVVEQERPDVLHSYLGVPNLLAVVLKPLLPPVKIVWAVRASDIRMQWYGWIPRMLDGLAPLLSCVPDLIIANSVAGQRHAVARGYPALKVVVVSNGIDTGRFAPCFDARTRFRHRWRIGAHDKLVGLVGRLDPIKDHATFLRAARMLTAARSDVRFACVGDGPDGYTIKLQRLAANLGLGDRIVWVPNQTDMNEVYNGLDVLCSTSLSEGFPNVVAEAMACGVPCVVTGVGDSARVVGRYGVAIPARDAQALADGIHAVLQTPVREIARIAGARRAWIASQFSLDRLLQASERALGSLLDAPAP